MVPKALARGLVAWFCGAVAAAATSVVPLSFEEMAARASAIALVQTVNVRSDWRTSPQGKHIVTVVTFRVERGLKGQPGQDLQLELLGGRIGSVVMDVDGMPQFHLGDRDVLFLSPNRASMAPIVGLFQGRFRVVGDQRSGTERVLTHDSKPFTLAAAGASRLRATLLSPVRPLSYSQFESLVLDSAARAGAPR